MLPIVFLAQQVAVDPIDLTQPIRECPPRSSEGASEGDVVVCARAGRSPYRLPEIAPFEGTQAIPRAAYRLTDRSEMTADVEAREVQPGMISNRAMIRYKLRF